MSEGGAWGGNWLVRLRERVRDRGYDSVTAFAEARPTASLVELAEELGKDDIAGVQIFQVLVDEAERSHKVTRLVRGTLVRMLWELIPDGWPVVMDDANRLEIAMAFGLWASHTPITHKERADQVMAALWATPPPPGWLPRGPDDERLCTLLPDEEA